MSQGFTRTTAQDAPQVIDRVGTETDVVNTAAETSLYSRSVTGGVMSTNRALRLTVVGDYFNNSGAGRTIQFKVKLGATTLYDDTSASIAASATRRAFRMEVNLGNRDSASSQAMAGHIAISVDGATTGLGDLATVDLVSTTIYGTAVEDTSSAKTFAVTVTHSTADPNLSIRLHHATLEVV